AKYIGPLCEKLLLIADDFVQKLTRPDIEKSFAESKKAYHCEKFNGECSKDEINRLNDVVKANNSDVVVVVGGGKTIDTAKAVAYYAKLPVVIFTTIASTDAPCSALSVVYTDEGEFDEYLIVPK